MLLRLLFCITAVVHTTLISGVYAGDIDTGILGANGQVSKEDIRSGNFTLSDVPNIINYATDFVLGFAATISVLVIIGGAIKMQLASFDDGKTEAKKIVTAGIIGFIISGSSWFIVNFIISNL